MYFKIPPAFFRDKIMKIKHGKIRAFYFGDPAGNLRLRAKSRRFAPRANGSDFFAKSQNKKARETRAFYFGDPAGNRTRD